MGIPIEAGIRRAMAVGIVVVLSMSLWLLSVEVYEGIKYNSTVEKYCSIANKYSVEDYKACRVLKQDALIKKLTIDIDKKNEVVNLVPIAQ